MEEVDKALKELRLGNNLRDLRSLYHEGHNVWVCGRKLLNLASNDYLGIAGFGEFEKDFFQSKFGLNKNNLNHSIHCNLDEFLNMNLYNDFKLCNDFFNYDLYSKNLNYLRLGSSSSRILSGNFSVYSEFENSISKNYGWGKKALLFNSGYHLNVGCISALAGLKNTLFVVDRQAHASMYDGLRLGSAKFIRYAHSDLDSLHDIIDQNVSKYDRIIVLTEALFSMDGDISDINALVKIKKRYQNVLLYIDEAHSVGAIGDRGQGVVYDSGLALDVDFIVFTFGKALASIGGAILCNEKMRSFFINKTRSLIYSTALPPLNIAYSNYVFRRILGMNKERKELQTLSKNLKQALKDVNANVLGDSYIISIIAGSNSSALSLAEYLRMAGYFAPAIRPPTVAPGSARVRLSLFYGLGMNDLIPLVNTVKDWIKIGKSEQ